ncbi:hypothetical protein J7656_10470 [Halorubrum ruber]|uniref:Uncharacterized protein n=1 Tax=Halorubrum ruber TaxID=2982524 RepID=A0A8T8LQE3_9EURY|nr:hypothetical protein J7656_10470 [Halorubrum ruber]
MLAAIYKRATGALEVFAADRLAAIYKRATGALEVFAADLLAAIYKRAAGALERPSSVRQSLIKI